MFSAEGAACAKTQLSCMKEKRAENRRSGS
jgi:hypothetical protein